MQPQPARNILVLATGNEEFGIRNASQLSSRGHNVTAVVSPHATLPAHANIECITLDDCAEDLEAAVTALFATCGRIDAVVLANSFVGEPAAIEHTGSAGWSETLRRNSAVAFLVSRFSVPLLKGATDPRMIFMVPELVRGMPEQYAGAYLSASATLIGLARTFALELGPDGITVNTVACAFSPDESTSRVTRTAHTPDHTDAVAAISFFLSGTSSFITGKTLDVNGGRSML
ncbi:SDR family oxidoreductase [Paraburkholderia oxyphila]|uniref:SDR family oxidoreductase n=1 Tax=Paraburkholderia oxyphila TaxID=614212 RepID=UPI00047FCD3D|nr:SDR family oxidoreductase [Paraburkholderia oxyphila]